MKYFQYPEMTSTKKNRMLNLINLLQTDGYYSNITQTNHTLGDVATSYILAMRQKYSTLGKHYLDTMEKNIDTIAGNVGINSNFDTIEYMYKVIVWYFNNIAFTQQNTTEKPPQLPDYILSEIKEMSQSITPIENKRHNE